jgi:hypothetical protein
VREVKLSTALDGNFARTNRSLSYETSAVHKAVDAESGVVPDPVILKLTHPKKKSRLGR